MGEKTLRRYTGLVSAIQILRTRSVTLLSPALWDDKNDAHSLERYRQAMGAGRVLALCLAEHYETYHHWKIYAAGPEGVCIEFDKERLIAAFQGIPGIAYGRAEYWEIKDLKNARISHDKLPFIKRFPYGDEEEFRIIYWDDRTKPQFQNFPIDMNCIKRINLSPWINPALDAPLRETIRSISGCEHVTLNRSQLVDYNRWKSSIDAACPLPAVPKT